MSPAPAPAAPEPAWRKRLLDMGALVAGFDAHAPVDWLLEPLVIPGTLAVVAGQGGSGKTWVMHEAAHAVVTGTPRAGMHANHGGQKALIVDAEMGQWLTVQRFASQGYSTATQVLDAQGMNLTTPEGRQELYDVIVALQPAFIGFDSLAALTSGADENSRETGDLVRWIRNVCHEVGAAGMLIHHAGWKEERTRGSSTIRDGADTVWYFKRWDEEGTRELNCGGAALKAPRWARPPAPIYMRLRDEGGLVAIDKPATPEEVKHVTRETALRTAVARGEVHGTADACAAVGVAAGNQDVREILKRIAEKRGGTYELLDDGPAV